MLPRELAKPGLSFARAPPTRDETLGLDAGADLPSSQSTIADILRNRYVLCILLSSNLFETA